MSGLSVRGVGGRVATGESHMLWGGFSGSVCSVWVGGLRRWWVLMVGLLVLVWVVLMLKSFGGLRV